jgi:dipeptidyl aminopeptidase/acylaminoacyl peptidase
MLAAYSAGDSQLPSSCNGESVPVKSVVNLYGPTDLTVFYRSSGSQVRGWMHRYIGGSAKQYPERYRILSPITYVGARTPPTITILGRADHLVPLEQAELLEKALTAAGVPHETYLLPSADHGFDANLNGSATRITREKVKAFLQKNG